MADVPVTTVLNTHHHGDHTWATVSTRRPPSSATSAAARDPERRGWTPSSSFHPEFGHIDVVPAFATFTDRLDVDVDDLKLGLHYVGPAHTTNDVVVWIPERRLMFTGDIAFNGGTPFIVQSSLGRLHRRMRARERVRRRAHRSRPRPRLRTRGALDGIFAEMIEFNSDPIRCFALPPEENR